MMQKLSFEELCMRLKPIFGKKIDEVYLRYTMADGEDEREEIKRILSSLYERNLSNLLDNKVLLEPPKEEVLEGEYPLGSVSYADKKLFTFNLREKDWIRHVCISGMSGSGKTTLAFHIINNFIKYDKPFLVFDWKKSFRPLILNDSRIMCFTIGKDTTSNLFKMNINQPPKGVSPKEWINVLCDLLTESFCVSFGVHKILLETLDEAFKEWGVYVGSENYPTWNHIKWKIEEKLDKAKGRESTWLESALRIATVLTFGDFGKVCNYKGEDKFNIEELLNEKIIFELNSLGNIEKKFFCEFILTYIYKLKKSQRDNANGKFEYAILVDEAHNIFLKDKTHFVKESVTDMIYREVREYGVSLICLDQHISKLSDTVKGNSACHIAFQQQLPQDIYDISELMQLREKRQFFSMLPVGSAIVKLSERYSAPFLVEVPNVNLRDKEVFDEDIADRMKCVIMEREVEKGIDPKFNRALIHPAINIQKQKVIVQPNIIEEKKEDKIIVKEKIIEKIKQESSLTPVQEILYEFVQKKLQNGDELKQIENILENYKSEGNYTLRDISKVINYAFEMQLNKIPEIKSKKEDTPEVNYEISYEKNNQEKDDLTQEQKKFMALLKINPNHDKSTIEIYKMLGLSTRKGNKIKDELMRKNLIVIEEQKNAKGWRKLIRINPNYH